jgi:phosphoglycerate dehydrogenase-like enzyme
MKIAILDDYQHLARRLADWSKLEQRCAIDVFDRKLADDEVAARLAPYDILSLVRERTVLPGSVISSLPNLKFIAATGPHNRTIDFSATQERGITVSCTSDMGLGGAATAELAWGLILCCLRKIPAEDRDLRRGIWQNTLGFSLYGKTLGLLGVGRIGATMARIGQAFGMRVIAWSPNLTDERAVAAGAQRVSKDTLFRESDVVSIHLVLGERSRGIVGGTELRAMKRSAYLINTARGPLVREADMIAALRDGAIAGAGLDVYDHEPLRPDHPLRALPNVILTPHLGYVTEEIMRQFYQETVENIAAFLDGTPIRILQPN